MGEEDATVLIHYEARPGKQERARKELAELIETVVRSERECIGISLSQDPADPTQFLLFERWTDRAAYEGEHMETDHMQEFIQRADQFMTGPPTITFWAPVAELSR